MSAGFAARAEAAKSRSLVSDGSQSDADSVDRDRVELGRFCAAVAVQHRAVAMAAAAAIWRSADFMTVIPCLFLAARRFY